MSGDEKLDAETLRKLKRGHLMRLGDGTLFDMEQQLDKWREEMKHAETERPAGAGNPRIMARSSRARRCYQLAGKGQDRAPEWMLVHGTGNGIEHAWLEYGETVYDAVLDRYYVKALYYEHTKATVDRRYTSEEAGKEHHRER